MSNPDHQQFSTFRISTGYDEPMCGIPSLDAAMVITVDYFRVDEEFNDFLDEAEPSRRIAFGSYPDELDRDRNYLAFAYAGDDVQYRAIGTIAVEHRCDCCRRVVRVETLDYNEERDARASIRA